ncbi:penicillin-binding transpeptidase domain-containing protein [Streptomyces sp. CRN 30]|uniref:penicillin-binding transpeptidase domain-containing protein n=1 Tax=Streptomyces sp. CRN 30 TaxID=3075613 RepID=UPI002A841224|nr:penicillin-binding transpeptidase domain-containing protein [Streptomyces sp. CRN 30]
MTTYIRRAAALCALLFVALLANATRIQVFQASSYDDNAANRRPSIARWGQPRGDIVVGGRAVTGSRDTGEQLRYERTYEDGPLYAPVTGFASQKYGATLLEDVEDRVLAGTEPTLSLLPAWNDMARTHTPGGRIVTTVHPAAQLAAYRALGSRRGAVAALEPATGRVLALVSTPSYDPGELAGNGRSATAAWKRLSGDASRPMLNRAIRQTYPPGSTFKVVTAAAALDAGLVRDVDAPTRSPDPYTLPGTSTALSNEVDGCEDASLRYAFEWSCNTVFARLGVRVGQHRMADTAHGLGFDHTELRIPLPVAPSSFATGTGMDRAQLALSSIGQFDTRATPLQMAMVTAAVANGGSVRAPYLVERATNASGGTVSVTVPRPPHQAMTPVTAARLRELMTGVVAEGTGGRAAVEGATVGGKTGTAQHGVGNSGTPYAWFISWARARDAAAPAVAVAVVVENADADRGEISGGGDAAPVARAVMEAVLGS